MLYSYIEKGYHQRWHQPVLQDSVITVDILIDIFIEL